MRAKEAEKEKTTWNGFKKRLAQCGGSIFKYFIDAMMFGKLVIYYIFQEKDAILIVW